MVGSTTATAVLERQQPESRAVNVPSSKGLQKQKDKNDLSSRLRREEEGWRRVIQHFTPSWFAVNMGTGIVSILLHTMSTDFESEWLRILSIIVFVLNVVLFTLFSIATVLRYVLYPAVWQLMIRHPVQSLFLGTMPMGLATIINMICLVCAPVWGEWVSLVAWGLWWLDSAISVACCVGMVFMIMNVHANSSLSSMTAVWLLPIVSPIVAAASGSIVASILPDPEHALLTIITSYALWGMGVPLAMFVLVIYLQRLTVHKLPPREVIVSVFLPIGPLGQGGFGIFNLGKCALETFPKTNTLHPMTGEILYALGFLTALIMWSFGLVWLIFAIASISREKFPFNMGWWGFTFPIGVLTTSTFLIAQELPSKFFQIFGVVLSGCVILLWLVVGSYTLRKAITGEMFFAPCLGSLPKAKEETERQKTV